MKRRLSRSVIRRRNQARKETFQVIALAIGFTASLPLLITFALILGSAFVEHSPLLVAWLNIVRSTLGGLV